MEGPGSEFINPIDEQDNQDESPSYLDERFQQPSSEQHEDFGEGRSEVIPAHHLASAMPELSSSNSVILLRAMTWNRESYGLFDYESQNLK